MLELMEPAGPMESMVLKGTLLTMSFFRTVGPRKIRAFFGCR